jgi:uncharacterized protein
MNQKLLRISIFYAVALLGSYVFRIAKPDWFINLTLPGGFTAFKYLAEGAGPAFGALLVIMVFKPNLKISFWGSSLKWSLIMLAVPMILFTGMGVQNDFGLQPNYYGFLVGIVSMLYVILEELGWRGYFLNELRGEKMSPWLRAVIIGSLWFAWHLNFNFEGEMLKQQLVFWALMIFGSWGFEKITDVTNSVVSVACFHLLGSILGYNMLIQNGLTETQKMILFGVCLVSWIVIVNLWKKENLKTQP